MPWKETRAVDEKMVLVAEFLKGTWTISELCRSFGISRKTGYKWIERYKSGGPGALSERSRAPHRCPHSLSDESAQMILAARKEHPTWGPRKILAWLSRKNPRMQPGRPDQNGSHERMHRTLKQEAAKPPKAALQAQQHAFDRFRDEYNFERPHEALDQSPPASWYRCSPRQYPQILPEFSYPRNATRRTVHESGRIRWKGQLIHIGAALGGEEIGLGESSDGIWEVWFGPLKLGLIDDGKLGLGLIEWPSPATGYQQV